MFKSALPLILLLCICACAAPAPGGVTAPRHQTTVQASERPLWLGINGDWAVAHNALTQRRYRAVKWGYHELMNYNSVVSLTALERFTAFAFTVHMAPRPGTKPRFMAAFAVTSPQQHYYYSFYGFLFTGTDKKVDRISLVRSERADVAKSFSAKNNFVITEIAATTASLPWHEALSCSIALRDCRATLSIDKKIMLTGAVGPDMDGKVGFACDNAILSLSRVSVARGDRAILEDDFTENTLYVPTARLRRADP